MWEMRGKMSIKREMVEKGREIAGRAGGVQEYVDKGGREGGRRGVGGSARVAGPRQRGPAALRSDPLPLGQNSCTRTLDRISVDPSIDRSQQQQQQTPKTRKLSSRPSILFPSGRCLFSCARRLLHRSSRIWFFLKSGALQTPLWFVISPRTRTNLAPDRSDLRLVFGDPLTRDLDEFLQRRGVDLTELRFLSSGSGGFGCSCLIV